MSKKLKAPKKLSLRREVLKEITGAGQPFPIPIPVSGRLTHCGCSNINSCGAGCGYSQLGPSCGYGPSRCICPSVPICPSGVC